MVRVSPLVSLAKIGINNAKKLPRAVDAIPTSKAEFKAAGKGMVQAGKAVPKKLVTSAVIDKKGPDGLPVKTLSNLYTGKKVNPAHLMLGGAAVIGGSAMVSSSQSNYQQPLKLATMNNYQEGGAAEIMNYDGVAQKSAPRNLNATGDIVFGLHNGRKG